MVHVAIENPEVHPMEEPEVQDPQGLHHPAPSPRSRSNDLHDSRNTQQEDLGRVKNLYQRRIQDSQDVKRWRNSPQGVLLSLFFCQSPPPPQIKLRKYHGVNNHLKFPKLLAKK